MRVILISGWANAASAMEPLAAMLGAEVECVDLSALERVGDSFSANGASAYAAGLIHLMGQGPCVVGGWSMGGLVAQEAYRLMPRLFAGLMFFSSTPKFCEGDGFGPGTPMRVVDGMRVMLKKSPEKVLQGFYAQCSGSAGESDLSYALGLGAQELGRGLDYLTASDFRDGRIDCPSLVFHGSRDLVIPFKAGRELASICGAAFVPVKGGHHDLVLSATDEVGAKAADFLREHC
jgi:pimeloyl-[acyl-carrier protein] methyl ester esterase